MIKSREARSTMRTMIVRLGFAVFVAVSVLTGADTARADKRVALVVGNSAYKNISRLENPANDAKLMANTLRRLGFTLIGNGAQIDLDKAAFDNAAQNFGRQLQGADVSLFYYAGHGVQVSGANYLVPVNANPTREADVDFQMVDVNLVLRQMQGSGTKLNLVILDACRNNPFGGQGLRSVNRGLAQMFAPEGTLISYATQPGNVAQDGADGNSPYTKALAQTISKAGLDIFQAFNEVGLVVKRSTGGAQQPWVSSSPIDGAFYFVAPTTGMPTELANNSRREDEATQAWAAVKDTTNTAILEAFIKRYRNSFYSDLARARLEELKKTQVAAIQPSVPPPSPKSPPTDGSTARALTNLAIQYETGEGVSKNDAEAVRLYRQSADLGDRQAILNLGSMYHDGRGAAQNYAEAMRLFQKAADLGDPQAMTNVGVMYSHGEGTPKNGPEAMRWYKKAAEAGHTAALTYLGLAYEKGDIAPKDYVEAARFYRRAADLGDRQAILNLGFLYYHGRGVEQNFAEALGLFRKAADLGDPQAMNNIGVMYSEGQGVQKNEAEANRWYQKATNLKPR
jgi:TPR repeat protein